MCVCKRLALLASSRPVMFDEPISAGRSTLGGQRKLKTIRISNATQPDGGVEPGPPGESTLRPGSSYPGEPQLVLLVRSCCLHYCVRCLLYRRYTGDKVRAKFIGDYRWLPAASQTVQSDLLGVQHNRYTRVSRLLCQGDAGRETV